MEKSLTRRRVYANAVATDVKDPYVERGRLFSQRLNTLMLRKGWSQAEMARQATLHLPPGVEINRQRISSYLLNGHLPNNVALHAIARALQVAPEDLVPQGQATFADAPFTMQSNGVTAHVVLNLTMTLADAMAVAAIVKKYAQ